VTRRDLHRLERAEALARGVSVERLRAMGREALASTVRNDLQNDVAQRVRLCDGLIVIGTVIRNERVRRGESMADVGKRVGVTGQAISRIELGHSTSMALLMRVAAELGIEIVARKARG
jgi:DNA-binding XRE family transcriptional regulator